jgi:FixJ family two-component response regulator
MTPAETPTVFVVDDDPSVRASIQGLLKSASLRSESFGTAEEFLRSKRPDVPSCLVLDVSLPGVTVWTFSATWLTGAFIFPSFSSPAMGISR